MACFLLLRVRHFNWTMCVRMIQISPPTPHFIHTAQLYRSVACCLRPDSAVILAAVDCLDAQWLPVHLTGLSAFTAPFRQIKVEQTLVYGVTEMFPRTTKAAITVRKQSRRRPRVLWRDCFTKAKRSAFWLLGTFNNKWSAVGQSKEPISSVSTLLFSWFSVFLLLLWSLTCSKLSQNFCKFLSLSSCCRLIIIYIFLFLDLKNIISLLWVKSLREQLP